ncbi:hypothetical protein [Microbacterium sp.]|uniref:hypothetical protein n=1 Tax=Microbacterium sp. TaxID=51671 RepID=UPI003F6FAC32
MGAIIGGSAFGVGDALIDTTEAVLLDTTSVAVVGAIRQTGAETIIALELGGRVNHSTERRSQLYLMNADGAAGIISELLGVAHRADPTFLDQLLARIAELPKDAS